MAARTVSEELGVTGEDAIVTYNFVDTFPFWTWVSSWGRDESHPAGFRYKLLSARKSDGEAELVLVLEEPDGSKTEMKRLAGDGPAILRTARTFVEGLAEAYAIEFDAFDFSEVETYKQFEQKAQSLGWLERQARGK